MRKSESKVEAEGENNSRVGPAGIEYVGCEVDFLVGEANEQTALDVKVSVVGLCPLGYKARATPVSRRVGQVHPAVEKTTRVVFCVEHIFTFGREFNSLPTERGQISRRKSGRGPKDTADHRGSFEDQFFTSTKVVTKPQRASLLVLIVVARSKVKPSAICRERRRGIGPVVRHDIAGDIEGERPLVSGGIGQTARRAVCRRLSRDLTHCEKSHTENRQRSRGRHPPREMVIPTRVPPMITIAKPILHGRCPA